jgi:hypothetical protein
MPTVRIGQPMTHSHSIRRRSATQREKTADPLFGSANLLGGSEL